MNQTRQSDLCREHSGLDARLENIEQSVRELNASVGRWTWAVMGAMGTTIVALATVLWKGF